MKILVLTGSPRKGANSDKLAESFAEGAKEAGNEVRIFSAGRKKIFGCKACKKCFSKVGKACVFDDDFNELAPILAEAEAIVFASPLYYYNMTSQIKAAIDKFYSFYVGGKELKIKKAYLLLCGETDVEADFEPTIATFKAIQSFMGWENAGVLIAPSVTEKGDIEKFPATLAKAKALGQGV